MFFFALVCPISAKLQNAAQFFCFTENLLLHKIKTKNTKLE